MDKANILKQNINELDVVADNMIKEYEKKNNILKVALKTNMKGGSGCSLHKNMKGGCDCSK